MSCSLGLFFFFALAMFRQLIIALNLLFLTKLDPCCAEQSQINDEKLLCHMLACVCNHSSLLADSSVLLCLKKFGIRLFLNLATT